MKKGEPVQAPICFVVGFVWSEIHSQLPGQIERDGEALRAVPHSTAPTSRTHDKQQRKMGDSSEAGGKRKLVPINRAAFLQVQWGEFLIQNFKKESYQRDKFYSAWDEDPSRSRWKPRAPWSEASTKAERYVSARVAARPVFAPGDMLPLRL